MNKKGFSLIELITVIALLSIIGVLLFPKISDVFKTSRADQLEEVRENVKNATDVYLNSKCGKNAHKMLMESSNIKIYLSSISDCGFIENKIYNPMNDEYFNIDSEYVEVFIDEVGFFEYKMSF